MHPKRCCQQITKLLYFLTQGETFTGAEAEAVFFGVTKLFQSTDGNLKRMVYLFLKAVAESTETSSLIIVTQSLVKDMFNETALYRANSLRVLSSIVDTSMLGQLERYYKQRWVGGGNEEGIRSLPPLLHATTRDPLCCPPQHRRQGRLRRVCGPRLVAPALGPPGCP
jgi:hypothetical protein